MIVSSPPDRNKYRLPDRSGILSSANLPEHYFKKNGIEFNLLGNYIERGNYFLV
jgi:hypothetical protein